MSEIDWKEFELCVIFDIINNLRRWGLFCEEKRKELAPKLAQFIIEKCKDKETGHPNFILTVWTIMNVPKLIRYILEGKIELAYCFNKYLHEAFNVPMLVDDLIKILGV
ncbi:MAG: hypothetical protein ACXQTI_00355 [Candidatus Nezhaarchaeales archaeon]